MKDIALSVPKVIYLNGLQPSSRVKQLLLLILIFYVCGEKTNRWA